MRESIDLILKRNPIPSVCGRVCHHPCETNCRRGQMENPVSIMMLKRFAADYTAGDKGIALEKYKGKVLKDKVAVIGSGPAGLSAAYQLAKRGYQVTVYESEKIAGGMLSLGIPEYRLPKDIVERDIKRMVLAGVKIKTGVHFGRDVSLKDLKDKDFKAVFLAIGAWKEVPLKIHGTDLFGFMGSLSFLKNYNTEKIKKIKGVYSIELDKEHNMPITGQKIAVIGGGNAAMDVARTCLRLGAAEVHVIYRRHRSDMPAIPEEVEECEKEGAKLHFLLIPNNIKGTHGKIVELECLQTKAGEFDASGRRKPVPTEEKFLLPVDIVISAIGGKPNCAELSKDKLIMTDWDTVSVDKRSLATNIPWVFAGGDVVTGGGTVIESIADGEKAAVSIDRYLKGERGEDLYKNRYVVKGERKLVPYLDSSKGVKEKYRIKHAKLSMEKRLQAFTEVDLGYTKSQSMEEADRCLRCDKKEAE